MICEFNKEDHIYTMDGIIVPSVTGILKKKSGMDRIPQRILEPARAKGTAVHMACEFDDEDDLDISSVNSEILPYIKAWQSFRGDMVGQFMQIEKPVYSTTYLFAGIPDRVILTKDFRLALIDIKTSKVVGKTVGLQLAGYEIAYKDMYGDCLMLRYAVQLKDTGSYSIYPYKSSNDFSDFLNELKIYKQEGQNGN